LATQNVPSVGALFLAGALQTALAASKLRLVSTQFTPGPTDTLAELEAIEATFSGYTSGGFELTTWLAPAYFATGGASITSPQIDVVYTPPGEGSPVTNTVYGWFLVDATGNLVADGLFASPQPMAGVGNAFTITLLLTEANLLTLVQAWVNGQLQ
jgi:hypothetical protein